jgi:hypothetical protein
MVDVALRAYSSAPASQPVIQPWRGSGSHQGPQCWQDNVSWRDTEQGPEASSIAGHLPRRALQCYTSIPLRMDARIQMQGKDQALPASCRPISAKHDRQVWKDAARYDPNK